MLPLAALPSQNCETVVWGLSGSNPENSESIIEPANDIYTVIDGGTHIDNPTQCYRNIRFNDQYFIVNQNDTCYRKP